MGLHPALFAAVIMLTLVAALTIALVLTGDIAEQGSRVFWTILAFAGFTGLLALDLSLSRATPTPLIIGTVANSYMIVALMLTIWMEAPPVAEHVIVPWSTYVLLYMVPLIVMITRAAWALAWLLTGMGERVRTAAGPVFGVVTASLVGVAGILLTLHYPLGRMGITLNDWYWRSLVAVMILAALASCVLMLLYWSQRTSDAKSRPQVHIQPVPTYAVPNPQQYGPPRMPQA